MDTFFEQLVTIKKDGKTTAAFIGIWLLAIILIALLFTLFLSGLSLFAAFGLLFGAYWLSSKLNVEFEYIITNGSMDIDKIINKSSRKRVLSLELPNVTRLEKYNPANLHGIDKKQIIFACNTELDNVYFLAADKNSKGTAYLVFAPDKRIKSAIEKFAPKFITNNVFDI